MKNLLLPPGDNAVPTRSIDGHRCMIGRAMGVITLTVAWPDGVNDTLATQPSPRNNGCGCPHAHIDALVDQNELTIESHVGV